jgi:hypothetical protein
MLRFAEINPCRSFPRKRESIFFWGDVDPRFRGGDDGGDSDLCGSTSSPCTLSITNDMVKVTN